MKGKLLTLALLGAAGTLLPGHSPYRQWYAYRAKHLIVVTDQARPGALAVAEAIASAIAARWPETKAVPAAARTPGEVVKLLSSGQLQVGLVPAADALEALEGRGRFDGKVPLRAVAVVGGDLLVVLESCARERARHRAGPRRISRRRAPRGKASAAGPGANPLPSRRARVLRGQDAVDPIPSPRPR